MERWQVRGRDDGDGQTKSRPWTGRGWSQESACGPWRLTRSHSSALLVLPGSFMGSFLGTCPGKLSALPASLWCPSLMPQHCLAKQMGRQE
ncbi:hypothetical protein DPEC_G00031470 [Dallia pectoralis]|uniref:Uncharacterized protein n=1 Tax=Dallia pectoralis TaxID=75939 RepID=A0ACC2HCW1_DALPE|nr:hypothetical protein DPEC_G00031470 [Dallia pectoralis]